MRHLSETTLALYAGGDLGWWARLTAERHLARCETCQADVAVFQSVTEAMTDLAELPNLSWKHMAAEMRANIRLGLDAGECIAGFEKTASIPLFTMARGMVAAGSLAVLVATAFVLQQRPGPPMAKVDGVVLEATGAGIERKEGFQALTLRHRSAEGITYTVGAQGLLRARYVDGDTGAVTINNVYVQ